ncbi:MAG TPA: FRG domain-containing protein [Longimicrobium sp.]|nr:FRG domain-containing protein [Longimicrobium sp.]
MEDAAFAAQLCAWLQPEAVAQAAAAFDASPQIERMDAEVSFKRAIAMDAAAIGLDVLADKFLRGFQVPAEYLELMASFYPQITPRAWSYAGGLRTRGQARYSGFPPERADDTALVLADRWALVRMVSGPLEFLIRYTASVVPLWSSAPESRADFFEHSSYGELLAFIEYTVASALGHEARVRSARPANAQVIYGDGVPGFSLVGQPPFGGEAAAREAVGAMFRGAHARWAARAGGENPPEYREPEYDFAAPPPAHLPAPGETDGFRTIGEDEAGQPWRNVARWRNEHSPYSVMGARSTAPALAIDTFYGRVFDVAPKENLGLYGITAAMPDAPGPAATRGFLRIPYRKVPRYAVRGRAELDAVLGSLVVMGDGSPRLYRGQAREYALGRSAAAGQVLYGDAAAVEPSLLATSTRAAQPLEAVLPAWCLLVRAFLEEVWSVQSAAPEVSQAWPVIQEDALRLRTGVDLHLYAIALAQHYGLPTMGLDVTHTLETALFFAVHVAERVPGTRNIRYRRKRADDGEGVLYVLAPDERYRLNHDLSRPRTIGGGRPELQGARFLVTGWGHHRNAVARHLAAALYLDPEGDFGPLPLARELFPPLSDDLFGEYLESRLADGLPPELGRYVEQLYWVGE